MFSKRSLLILSAILITTFFALNAAFKEKPKTSFTEGSNYKGFLVKKSINIKELDIKMIELVHEKTGAKVLHLANDDTNNLFCLSFKTFPERSDGAAHILEHTTLCGSEKYPVNDLFQSMRNRSLNTFVNALTGDDFTCYPGSSQIEQDFYNLLSVYTDSVFHPMLHPLSFRQEGHRLEFANPSDPTTPLEVKGVVYNEMKGALSQPQRRLKEIICQRIFPGSTYAVNSGGDPAVIPDITHEELLAFHKKYYHPSNCVFFFYGNLPLNKHLDFLLENALQNVEKREQISPPPPQKRFLNKETYECFYPVNEGDPLKNNSYISSSWLTCPGNDQKTALALSLIDSILMGSDAAYLKKALLSSNLCTQVYSEFDVESYEVPYTINLSGCNEDVGDKIDDLIQNTLVEVVKNGIPSSKVETALHQLEFAKSEIASDHYPFGLILFIRSALLMQHGGAPEDGLRFQLQFNKLRDTIKKNPRYLEGLIQEYLILNPHSVRVVMNPSSEYQAFEINEEKERLQKIKDSLSKEQIEEIITTSNQLFERQNNGKKENVEVLPKVSIKDVPKKTPVFSLNEHTVNDLKAFYHQAHTNSITYADLVFSVPKIKEDELWLYSLFATILPEIGCGSRNYKQNLEYIQEYTGGIQAVYSINQHVDDFNNFSPALHIQGKALDRNAPHLFRLFYDIAVSLDFSDQKRIRELVIQHWTNLKNELSNKARDYALCLSSSSLNSANRVINGFYGLEYYSKIESLANNIDERLPSLIENLQTISSKVLSNKNAHLVITSSEGAFQRSLSSKFYGLASLPLKEQEEWSSDFILPTSIHQAWQIPSSVSYTTKSFQTVSYTHPDAPKLELARHLFYNLTLYKRIRQQGGAYGAGAIFSPTSGNFSFFSYRDPNIASTLKAFDEAVSVISSGDFTARDLEEAQLKALQALDIPISPGLRGAIAYKFLREGRKESYRQAYRDQLLSLTTEDVKAAVSQHLDKKSKECAIASLGNKDLIDQRK